MAITLDSETLNNAPHRGGDEVLMANFDPVLGYALWKHRR
jgi:hypothetical protein